MTGREVLAEVSRGDLELIVLSIVAEGATYGYRIQQRLVEVTGGMARLPAGTLYPLLHRLEADGLIRARWEAESGRKRKWYELTASGDRRLRKRAVEWSRWSRCLAQRLAPILNPKPQPS
jgi:PadR family transcriptional regulator PadR